MKNTLLDIEAANVVLCIPYTAERLPSVAERALMEGYDSPALRMLSGLTKSQTDEAILLFKKALSELNVPLPDQQEAVLLLAQEIAAQILRGELSPYQGAKKIWQLKLIIEPNHNFHELDPFIYAASEWEDRPEDRAMFEHGIIEEARGLLGRRDDR